MPLPLVPIAVVGAVGAGVISSGDAHEVPGAVPHPDAAAPEVPEIRPPPAPRPPTTAQTVTTPGNASPPDPPMQIIEGGIGTVSNKVKEAVVGAGAVGVSTVLGGGTIGEGFTAAASSVGSSASSAASGAVSAIGPGVVVAADAAMIAGAVFTMFGGDPEDIIGHTYATTPQLDATTPLGQAAARAQAPLLRASLQTQHTKFGFKGETDPANFIPP